MYDVKLIVNGREFPVHYQLLQVIAKNFPRSEQYGELARALLALNLPSITENLLNSPLLNQQDRDAFWEAGDLNIRRSLAGEQDFLRALTDAQARDILTADDLYMLKRLAFWAELFDPDGAVPPEENKERRLSAAMAEALLEHMARSRYPGVRRALAENGGTPQQFRPSLREGIELGLGEWDILFSNLQPEDVELLGAAAKETLQSFAYVVERIENRTARQGVIDMLCAHPDPAVRLELAENRRAPRSALKRLLEDDEPDVVQAARRSLDSEE